jgi:adhesin transport system outer membrane protein
MKQNTHQRFAVRAVVALTCAMASFAQAQALSKNNLQTISLNYLLDSASATYPTLQAARLEARASSEDVSATERIRWPTISATVETYTGNARSYASRAVQVDQTIWDAGHNTARISESKALADISLLKVYLQQQDLFIQIVNAWQNMIGAIERVKVAELTVTRLQTYQAQMRRRVEAEASPRIDLELADARLLQTDVELTTAKTSLQVAITRLEQLSGEESLATRLQNANYRLTLISTQPFAKLLSDTDWLNVASEHPSSAKARIEVVQIRRRLEAKQAEGYPQLFVRVYKPVGVIPSSNDTSATTFVGWRYSPGAGFANFAEAQAIGTRISSSEQNVEAAIREIQQTLQNDREEFVNARSRIAALEKSVASSALVLESYQRQFQAGRKQWQDLLNQVRELAQNQYALADAQSAMVGAMSRLQIRMGQDPQ